MIKEAPKINQTKFKRSLKEKVKFYPVKEAWTNQQII